MWVMHMTCGYFKIDGCLDPLQAEKNSAEN